MKQNAALLAVILLLGVSSLWLYARPQPSPRTQPGSLPAASTLIHQQVAISLSSSTSVVTATTTPPPLLLALATSIHVVGTPIVSPTIITANTSTQVEVTVTIIDPALIPGSVNSVQLGSPGTQPTILGTMQNLGNGTYALDPVFKPPQAGEVQLEASAAFQGQLKRVISAVLQVSVWAASPVTYNDPSFAITIPSNWTASTETISQGNPVDPLRSIQFSIPTDAIPVLFVLIYPHGADVIDQADDAPGFLGTDNTFDFYFQMRNSPADPSTLVSLGLTPDLLQQKLLKIISTFKMH